MLGQLASRALLEDGCRAADGALGGAVVNTALDVSTVETFPACPRVTSASHRARAGCAGKPGRALPGVKLLAGS